MGELLPSPAARRDVARWLFRERLPPVGSAEDALRRPGRRAAVTDGHGAPRDPRAGRPVDAEARARAQKPAADARPMLAAGVVDYADL